MVSQNIIHEATSGVYHSSSHPLRSCSYVTSDFLPLKCKIRGVHKIFLNLELLKNRATIVDIIIPRKY